MSKPVLLSLSPSAVRAELASRHYQLLTARNPLPFSSRVLRMIRRALDTGHDEHFSRALKASTAAMDEAGVR